MTTKEELRYEIQMFENLKGLTLDGLQEKQRRYDLASGLILGLLYGVIGNLFVQFFYPVIEKIVVNTYDSVFYSDLVVSIVALVLIIVTTLVYWQRLKNLKSETSTLENSVKVFESALQRRKHQLEQ